MPPSITKKAKNVAYENNDRKIESVYSRKIKAGKRRTYFFDVRETRGNDYFLTITESRKKFNEEGYERHKIFLYKEDFNKFIKAINEAVDYVKTELMPDFDFDSFNHEYPDAPQENGIEQFSPSEEIAPLEITETPIPSAPEVSEIQPQENINTDEVDKW